MLKGGVNVTLAASPIHILLNKGKNTMLFFDPILYNT
jgi:hypothetical protein